MEYFSEPVDNLQEQAVLPLPGGEVPGHTPEDRQHNNSNGEEIQEPQHKGSESIKEIPSPVVH